MFAVRTSLLAVAAGLLLPMFAVAWTPQTVRTSASLIQLKWTGGNVSIQLNTAHGSNISGSDADIQSMFESSLAAWQNISNTSLNLTNGGNTTTQIANSSDRTNMVLFSDNVTGVGGALAVTFSVFNAQNGNMADADIVFNTGNNFSATTPTSQQFDLRSVLTHEMGHLLGLDHSNVLSATMFQSTLPGVTLFRSLSDDDVAGMRAIYPGSTAMGAITGRVTKNGSGVVGAAVYARNTVSGAIIASGISQDSNGTFSIRGLPDGTYGLGVEPLDGSMFQENIGGGYFGQIGAFDENFNSIPPPALGTHTVAGGNTVDAGTIAVSTAASSINPTFNVNILNAGYNSITWSGAAVTLQAGTTGRVLVVVPSGSGNTSAGNVGIGANTTVAIPGTNIVVGAGTPHTGFSGITPRDFPLTVPLTVVNGSYDIVFSNADGSTAVMVGGLKVTGGATAVNTPPVARIRVTPSGTITVNQEVSLSASDSTDSDGSVTGYAWTVTGPQGSVFVTGASNVNASFTPSAAGSYTINLVVTDDDGAQSTAAQTNITVDPLPNQAPVAAITGVPAGAVDIGTTIQLSASSSTDGDGTVTGYAWTVTGPQGSVFVTGASSVNASFVPDRVGTFTVSLVVTDDDAAQSAAVQATVSVVDLNVAPTAQITVVGSANVVAGTVVQLNAGGSSDPEARTMTYAWSLISSPASVPLTGANTFNLSFTPTTAGSYGVRLTVTDDRGLSDTEDLTVTARPVPVPPTAEAGSSRTVQTGAQVILDGRASRDPAGQALNYLWTQNPADANQVTIDFAGTAVASFIPPSDGTYRITLTVTDTESLTASEEITLESVSTSPATTDLVLAAGLNLISFPIQQTTTNGAAYTAADLIHDTGAAFVAKIVPGSAAKSRLQVLVAGNEVAGQNFAFEGSFGYAVSVPASTTLTVSGLPWPASTRSVALQRGLNLVGPQGLSSAVKTWSALTIDTRDGGLGGSVSEFDLLEPNGHWRVFVDGISNAVSEDRLFEPGRGYVVTSPRDVTVTFQ